LVRGKRKKRGRKKKKEGKCCEKGGEMTEINITLLRGSNPLPPTLKPRHSPPKYSTTTSHHSVLSHIK